MLFRSVSNMSYIFDRCSSLTNINLSNFNTNNVTDMSWMFYGCLSLNRKNVIVNDIKILKELGNQTEQPTKTETVKL